MTLNREKVIQSAEKFVSRGKIDAAIKEYRKLLEENQNDISTLNRVGDLYARIDRSDEAARLFLQIAQHYTAEGFFVKAIAIYKKIIKLDPTRLEIYEKLAELYARQGLSNEAKAQFQVLADYYAKHQNAASAIAVHNRMVDLEPDNPTHHVKLAELYQSQGLLEKAMAEYRIIAELMMKFGRPEEASKVYHKALDLNSNDLAFVTDAVLGLRQSGATGLAAKLLAAAVEKNPQAERIASLAGMRRDTGSMQVISAEATAPPLPSPAPVPPPAAIAAPPPAAPPPAAPRPVAPMAPPSAFSTATLPPAAALPTAPAATPSRPPAAPVPSVVTPPAPAAAAPVAPARPPAAPPWTSPAPPLDEEPSFEIDLDLDQDLSFDLTADDAPSTLIAPPVDLVAQPRPGAAFAPPLRQAPVEPDFAPDDDVAWEIDLEAEAGPAPGGFGGAPASTVEEEVAFELEPAAEFPPLELDWADAEAAAAEVERAGGFPGHAAADEDAIEIDLDLEPEPTLPAGSGWPPFSAEPEADLSYAPEAEEPAVETPPLAPPPVAEVVAPPPAVDEDIELELDLLPPDLGAEVDGFPIELEPAAELDLAPIVAAVPVPAPRPLEPATEPERRPEDLLAEAEVFAKYGLREKAQDRLREILAAHPQNLEAHAQRLLLSAEDGNAERVQTLAQEMRAVATRVGNLERWEKVRLRLTKLGYQIEGQGEVRAAPPKKKGEDRISALLESLVDVPKRKPVTPPTPAKPTAAEVDDALAGLLGQRKPPSPVAPVQPPPAAARPVPPPAPAAPPRPVAAPSPPPVVTGPPVPALVPTPAASVAPPSAPPSAPPTAPPTAPAPPPQLPVAAAPAPLSAPSAPSPPPASPPSPARPALDLDDDELPGFVMPRHLSSEELKDRDRLEDTGSLSWLDEKPAIPTIGPGPAVDKEALFDEEEFFDLAAELEEELSGDQIAASDMLVQPQEQSLEEIVEGFKKGVAENLSAEDYATHYNLGIAYREMGLVDEAIGEFQLASKDPGHLADCCAMLGLCFVEKGLPELAIKWYRRALETPNLSEESSLGLLYDMGDVYMIMGDWDAARKTFVELYGINSNYRDVVAKLAELEN